MKNQFISKLITFSRKIKYCSPANLIFEKNYSPNYLLRTLTEMIRNTHDNSSFACSVL